MTQAVASDPIRVRVLVVDDLEDNLLAFEALLRAPGIELLLANSGREALELMLVHDVAVALLDVQMPEMNGYELAELMRGSERTRNIPIVFVTAGSRDPSVAFRGYELGAVDFLFKPVEPTVLRTKVETFVRLCRQKQEIERQLVSLREIQGKCEQLSRSLEDARAAGDAVTAALSSEIRPAAAELVSTATSLATADAELRGKLAHHVADLARRLLASIDGLRTRR
jgi:two-component system, sensor histidine kinase and response regulator